MKNIVKVGAMVGTATVFSLLSTTVAFAQEAATTATATGMTNTGLAYLAAYLGLGIAALGGALSQARVASAALEGIARNPQASDKLFTPLILALAFIESLVIYALVVALIKT